MDYLLLVVGRFIIEFFSIRKGSTNRAIIVNSSNCKISQSGGNNSASIVNSDNSSITQCTDKQEYFTATGPYAGSIDMLAPNHIIIKEPKDANSRR